MWLLYAYFSFVGFQCKHTKVVEGIYSYAYSFCLLLLLLGAGEAQSV
jgi:hypothetical protein